MTFLTDEQLDKAAEDYKKIYAGLGKGYYERSLMFKVIEQAKKANDSAYETGRRNAMYKNAALAEEMGNKEIAEAIRRLI
jgi:hypothetical protein